MIYCLLGSAALLFFAVFVMRKVTTWESQRLWEMKLQERELQAILNHEMKTKRTLSLKLHDLTGKLKYLEYQLDDPYTGSP